MAMPESSHQVQKADPKRPPSKIKAANVRLERAYVPAQAGDGTRVLIDRLWPRGVRTADAAIDLWLKEIAPSTELRQWFGLDPVRWPEFGERYAQELRRHPELVEQLCALARKGPVTLFYAAHDEQHNDAVLLRAVVLRGRI